MKQRMFPSANAHGHRARLLVEDPDPALHVAEFRRFQDAGFDVALCEGPGEDSGQCPLVQGEHCTLAEQADIVLMGPRLAPCRAEIAAAHHRRRPALPVVVQVPRDDPGQCPTGCIPDCYPSSVDGQIRTLWRALDQWGERRPVEAAPPVSTAVDSTTARLVDLLGW